MQDTGGSWRSRLRAERPLMRELALMLVAMLVIGLYFLEHLDKRLAEQSKLYQVALAEQTANAAGEYLVADNRLSLAVLARQSAQLAAVSRVEVHDSSGRMLASAGETDSDSRVVRQPIKLAEGDMVGQVVLWPAPNPGLRQQLETGFVLIALCLLLLWVVMTVLWRRLNPADEPSAATASGKAANQPGGEVAAVGESDNHQNSAVLRLCLVNHGFLSSRYTPSLMNELLADYHQLLEQVAKLYAGEVERNLADQALLRFSAAAPAEAAFNALCAGQLFLHLARDLAARRKAEGRPALEFKLLVTTRNDKQFSWGCCEAGRPGRVHLLECELVDLDLDTRVLYRNAHALDVVCEGEQLRLQPIEQLAQRYQKLISAQGEKLMGGLPA